MSMINTGDDNKGIDNQEVTKPVKQNGPDYQNQLAEVLRNEVERHPHPKFKNELRSPSLDTTEIVHNQKTAPKAAPLLSDGASQLVKQTSHIYSEPLSKITIDLLDS